MVQKLSFLANSVVIGSGDSAVTLGANSGSLVITDVNSNVVTLVPGQGIGGLTQYLQVANSTNFITSSSLTPYLQVANAATTLAALTDVAQATPTDGHVLKYASANTTYYFAAESGGGSSTLASLTDVAQATPTDGHVLKYSSANTTYYFAAESGGGGGDADYGLITGSADSTADYGAIT